MTEGTSLLPLGEGNTSETSAPASAPSGALTRLLAHGRSHWFRCLLLVLVGFVVRMPALQGQRLWDDDYLVEQNPFMKSPLLIPEAFRHYLFPESLAAHYRPVQNISFTLDYFLWNLDPYGFHLTNVLLHLACGLLLYFLLRHLLAQFPTLRSTAPPSPARSTSAASLIAFLVALLWVVHPVHSAAVDYISGRADSLSFLFASAGWLIFVRARTQQSRRTRVAHYGAAAFCGLLALCSREIAVIWFCLFALHILFFDTPMRPKAKLVTLACLLLLIGSYVALRQLPGPSVSPTGGERSSLPVRAVLMLRALGDYGRLMVYPSTLYMERSVLDPDNYHSVQSWRRSIAAEYLSLLGALVLCALALGARQQGGGRPLRIFGALWFILGYLPISNLIELNANVAEHWLYLPSVGFLLFLAGCVLDLPSAGRKISVAFACLAIAGLSIRAFVRSTDWVTQKTFYQRTLAAGGTGTRVAANLGLTYADDGELAKAEAIFRRVLQVTPDYPIARYGLANVLFRQGKRAESETIFAASKGAASEARKDYPRTWMAALSLARIRHDEGNDKEALAILKQARTDYPQTWDIIRLEAEILRKTKGPEAALRLVAEFARDNWWHYGASLSLGRLLAERGDVEDAVSALQFASWLDVHDAEALNLVATMRLRQNRLEEARAAQQRAVGRQPDEPRQYRLLSDILLKMGRDAEAQLAVAKIASLEAVAYSHPAPN